MDGYSRVDIIRKIILPLAGPGIAVTAILTFIFCWNEYLGAAFLTGTNTQTLPLFLSSMRSTQGIQWEVLFAASTIQLIPAICFVVLLQKQIVRGLTLGAVTR